jgi:predicted ArsR family transcriptional regulator
VADAHGQVCSHHQRLLSALLRVEVEPIEPATVNEESYCAYRVREEATTEASVS